jgi:hypothetical protein
VCISSFVDAYHAGNVITWRSHMEYWFICTMLWLFGFWNDRIRLNHQVLEVNL